MTSASQINIQVGHTVGAWRVTKELGRGTYGAVFKVVEDRMQREGAMKVESRLVAPDFRMLKLEVNVMIELREKKCKNCVHMIEAGLSGDYNYLVMNLVGPNLESLVEKLNQDKAIRKFNLHTAFYVATNTLETMQDLHRVLFLHRDIKPQNFAVGCRSSDYKTIYLLDFGTTRRYAKDSGQHHRPRAKVAFRGSTLYASVGALMEIDQGRRDDMWSWFFMVIRLTRGLLPWYQMESVQNQMTCSAYLAKYAKIKEQCINNPKLLLHDCPPEFEKVWLSLKGLYFFSRPDYETIKRELQQGYNRSLKECNNQPLDWDKMVKPQTSQQNKQKSQGAA